MRPIIHRLRFAILFFLLATSANAATVLHVATLAPQRSPWGKALGDWAQAVSNRTNQAVTVRIDYNGAQGDEAAMVARMRAGQLDGAILNATGLAAVNSHILALEMPGVFSNWNQFGRAVAATMPDLDARAQQQGFKLVGIAGMGWKRPMAKGRGIWTPQAYKSLKLWADPADPVSPIAASVGGYTPVVTPVPNVLPSLGSGRVTAANVPSYMAAKVQWTPHFTHITDLKYSASVLGLVLRTQKLNRLASRDRQVVLDQAKNKVIGPLGNQLQTLDNQTWRSLKGQKQVIAPNATQRQKWVLFSKTVRNRLGQGIYPAQLIQKVQGFGG